MKLGQIARLNETPLDKPQRMVYDLKQGQDTALELTSGEFARTFYSTHKETPFISDGCMYCGYVSVNALTSAVPSHLSLQSVMEELEAYGFLVE